MTPRDFFRAARVPESVAPGEHGPWFIERVPAHSATARKLYGGDFQTVLYRNDGDDYPFDDEPRKREIVMEDSIFELSRHLPIWLAARGRVLVTGLGLGCVVRGLLAKPEVERIDVVELCPHIFRVVGAEFVSEPRVRLFLGDAVTYKFEGNVRWDFAWHDIWTELGNVELHKLHVTLIHRFRERCPKQGAWQLPRFVKRIVSDVTLGARRRCVVSEGRA